MKAIFASSFYATRSDRPANNKDQRREFVPTRIRLRNYVWALVVLWTTAFAFTLSWALIDKLNRTRDVLRPEAQSASQDRGLLRWYAARGGVFVPAPERRRPIGRSRRAAFAPGNPWRRWMFPTCSVRFTGLGMKSSSCGRIWLAWRRGIPRMPPMRGKRSPQASRRR